MRKPLLANGLLALVIASSAAADQVFTQDVIIDEGLLCVGLSCFDGEPDIPGQQGLKLKSIHPAILFEDTSPITSPTRRDWQLTANDDSVGVEAFFLRDVTSGTNPVWVGAAAPSNALFVEGATGDIGLGTMFPARELHIMDVFIPTIRMEETGSSPYTWDIAAYSEGFFVQDISNSRTPIRIRPGAPSASLEIENNGNVGMGTTVAEAPLHVVRNSAGAPLDMMRLENNGGVVFRLKDTSAGGQEFTFQSNGGIFRIASPAVPGPEFTMDDFGNVTIKGEITTAGSCSSGCDRVFDESYDLPDMTEHHAAMWELGHLPNVGPTAEDGPMNLSEKVGGILNELEHAHIFIDQQQQQIAQQHREMIALKDTVRAQMSMIEALSNRLSQIETNE